MQLAAMNEYFSQAELILCEQQKLSYYFYLIM